MGENIIFDPNREEIAVADAVLAISVTRNVSSGAEQPLKLLSIRTVDPPSRLTGRGVPDAENSSIIGATGSTEKPVPSGDAEVPGVWRPRRGGIKRGVVAAIVKNVLKKGGVGEEVLSGLEGVEVP